MHVLAILHFISKFFALGAQDTAHPIQIRWPKMTGPYKSITKDTMGIADYLPPCACSPTVNSFSVFLLMFKFQTPYYTQCFSNNLHSFAKCIISFYLNII